MAVQSYKMGPGTLTLGTAGAEDVSAQVTNARVEPAEEVTTTDAIPVLSGEEIPAEDDVTHAFTLAGTFLQDITLGGVIDYTWTNAGDTVDFVFIPNTTAARQVSGQCRLVPLTVGGDVKSRPTTDFSWKVIGTPTFGAVV